MLLIDVAIPYHMLFLCYLICLTTTFGFHILFHMSPVTLVASLRFTNSDEAHSDAGPMTRRHNGLHPGRLTAKGTYKSPCKLTVRWHGKSTILMVFTGKDRDFHGRTVSFREGNTWGSYGSSKRPGC